MIPKPTRSHLVHYESANEECPPKVAFERCTPHDLLVLSAVRPPVENADSVVGTRTHTHAVPVTV